MGKEKGYRVWINEETLNILDRRIKEINHDYYIQRTQGHHNGMGFNVNEAIKAIFPSAAAEEILSHKWIKEKTNNGEPKI